jgi:hypothetical protein
VGFEPAFSECERPQTYALDRAATGTGRTYDISYTILQCFITAIRNIISPVVLYGSVTWSLTLRKESRLRVFENWVLREMFGTERDEVTRGLEIGDS